LWARLVLSAGFAAVPVVTSAQIAYTPTYYAGTIALNVPTAAATTTCTNLPATAPTTPLTLKRTFFDGFDTLDQTQTPNRRWAPNYDGGYDTPTSTFLGYDWVVKRYQPTMSEQQIYVDSLYKGLAPTALGVNPFVVENGTLHIVAQRTPDNLKKVLSGFEYTSGLLTTRQSFSQRYGYFEARIKVPNGKPLLPAFWMKATNRFLAVELDVMEAPTHLPDVIQQSVHWSGVNGAAASSGCRTTYPKFSEDFHQYGALWMPDKIVYYIDRLPVGQIVTPPGMNQPMFMQLNLAVGGIWTGVATASTVMPAEMLVDAVAAYTVDGPNACGKQTDGTLMCPAK
jgi:beta-glucanase (GH16 family)